MGIGGAGGRVGLTPYVPRLVEGWLAEHPEERYREIDGTLLFADISGYTQLTEELSRMGKEGAEELSDHINSTFEALLAPAYDRDGGLIKWGGDAVLLLFTGPGHEARAVVSAHAMQEAIERVGRIRTSRGQVALRMSIGVHGGSCQALLVGSQHRELVIVGPVASGVALMEKRAEAGEVLVSTATAQVVADLGAELEPRLDDAHLLLSPPATEPEPVARPERDPLVDLGVAMDPGLRDHIVGGGTSDHEHRHVAVGFLLFTGADELARDPESLTDAVDELVSRSQEAAHANGVTVLNVDLNADGGKVLFTSGAPQRRGDDEARVVNTLLEVMAAPSPFERRGGANAGRVFAGDFGPSFRRTYSILGDCVNLAARLMAAAEPGQIWVPEPMLEALGDRFQTVAREPMAVKGKAEPVHPVQVVGTRDRRTRATASDLPLVGRQAEMGILAQALDDARRGAGRAVDVVGPAGIGKSRLLEELAATANAPILWLDGDIYAQAIPYQPVRTFVRDQLNLATGAPREVVARDFAAFIRSSAPELVPWLPLVGRVIDADYPMTDRVAALDPSVRRERMEWAIRTLLDAFVTEPSVIVFNDTHLMDEATISLLRYLVESVRSRPWVLVAAYRPDERAAVADHSVVIELAPLDQDSASTMLLAATEREPLAPHVIARLAERAGGNPLFLHALAVGARRGLLDEELPESVESVVATQIDRLPPSGRRALRTAAVQGMTIDAALYDAVIAAEGSEDGPGFAALVALEEFVEPLGAGQARFRHHLVREAAYEGLPFRRRRTLHSLTARAITETSPDPDERADLLSLHCSHGRMWPEAWRYSRIAGDRARDQYAFAEAVACYRRALSAAPHLEEANLDSVSEALGDAYFELGEFGAAESAHRQALATATEPSVRARLRLKVSLVRETTGDYRGALRWLTMTRSEVEGNASAGAQELRGRALVAYARIRYFQGRHREAIRGAEDAVAHAKALGLDLVEAQALEYIDLAKVAMGDTDGPPASQRSLEIYRRAGDLKALARAHNGLGMRAYFLGSWAEAIEHYDRAAEATERAGRTWATALARANSAEVLSDQGHLERAREIFEASVRTWRGIGAESEVAFGTYMLGRIEARSGRGRRALALYEEAREVMARIGEQDELRLIDTYEAEALMLLGQIEQARVRVDALLAARDPRDGVTAEVPLLHRVRGQCLLALGDGPGARAALVESVVAARARRALHEVALGLDLLIRSPGARDSPELHAWQSERDRLWTTLGLAEAIPGADL